MRLVGMQQVELARQAHLTGATVPEGLHPARGDPEGVLGVPVARECRVAQYDFRSLQARGLALKTQHVDPAGARSFKTCRAGRI